MEGFFKGVFIALAMAGIFGKDIIGPTTHIPGWVGLLYILIGGICGYFLQEWWKKNKK